MKQGKKPNRKQKEAIKEAGLNPENWLVTKSLPQEIHIVHCTSNKPRIIKI